MCVGARAGLQGARCSLLSDPGALSTWSFPGLAWTRRPPRASSHVPVGLCTPHGGPQSPILEVRTRAERLRELPSVTPEEVVPSPAVLSGLGLSLPTLQAWQTPSPSTASVQDRRSAPARPKPGTRCLHLVGESMGLDVRDQVQVPSPPFYVVVYTSFAELLRLQSLSHTVDVVPAGTVGGLGKRRTECGRCWALCRCRVPGRCYGGDRGRASGGLGGPRERPRVVLRHVDSGASGLGSGPPSPSHPLCDLRSLAASCASDFLHLYSGCEDSPLMG